MLRATKMMQHKIAKVTDVRPGTGKIVTVSDKKIALFNYGGKYFAMDNTCPHAGGPLGEGVVLNKTVTCTWHKYQYDITSGKCLTDSSLKVKTYTVKVEGDNILLLM
jgi:NAD(P)H-dependent nitrite reductase small subunit